MNENSRITHEDVYRDIPEFPNYELSYLGTVRNKKYGGREVHLSYAPDGYVYVSLRRDGKSHTRSVKKLMREIWDL